jgi:hypothetical protein
MFKKLMLAALMAVSMAQAAIADETSDAASGHWKFNHSPGGYCEEIYWEDEYNCLDPERIVTRRFCMTEKFDEARKMCLRQLEKQKNLKGESHD